MSTESPIPEARRSLAVQCLVYLSFAAPIGMLGAGWPEARLLFGRSSGALGLVAGAYGVGRLTTSATALALLRRLHIRQATTSLALALAAACTVAALTRSFPVLVAAFAAIGLVSGALDSLGNRYQSVIRHVGSAGLMFGAYGVGATLGPALVAVTSWTVGYLAAAALLVITAILAIRPSVPWPGAFDQPSPARVEVRGTRVPAAATSVSLAVFFLFCAMEVVTGNWASSYLEEGRGLGASVSAGAVSGFWGGMTLGRLLLGRLRLDPQRLLAGGAGAALALFVAIALVPAPLTVVGFALVGVALAPIVPTLMSTTADRVGVAAAGRVTGWQLLAANIGGTGLSALVGFLVDDIGATAPIWVLAALALVGLPVLRRSATLAAR